MDYLSVILAATIPAFIVAAVAFLMINRLLKAEETRRRFEVRKDVVKTTVPVKLRAYERMALFLERVAPESLLTRQNLKDINAMQLQASLLQQIRQEWEHNLSQQLYISNDAWIMLRNAKESMVQLVNTCAAQASMNTSAIDYAKLIIETYQAAERTPLQVAMNMLKSDLSKIY